MEKEPIDSKREEVLSKANHLRSFLAPFGPWDLTWTFDMEATRKPIEEAIEAKIGKDWIISEATLGIMAQSTEVLNPVYETRMILGIMHQLIILGYDLGAYDNVNLFADDIRKQFIAMTIYSPDGPFFEENENSSSFIKGALNVGTYYSMIRNKPEDDSLKSFRDFISGIDQIDNI